MSEVVIFRKLDHWFHLRQWKVLNRQIYTNSLNHNLVWEKVLCVIQQMDLQVQGFSVIEIWIYPACKEVSNFHNSEFNQDNNNKKRVSPDVNLISLVLGRVLLVGSKTASPRINLVVISLSSRIHQTPGLMLHQIPNQSNSSQKSIIWKSLPGNSKQQFDNNRFNNSVTLLMESMSKKFGLTLNSNIRKSWLKKSRVCKHKINSRRKETGAVRPHNLENLHSWQNNKFYSFKFLQNKRNL